MHNKSISKTSGGQFITRETADGQACVVTQHESVQMFSGPLPHPDLLREYEKMIPDAPKKIFAMAEKQNEHRISIEKTFVEGNMKLEKIGVLFGVIIPVMGMICGTIIIITGHSVIGFISIVSTLLPSSGSYMYSLYKKQKKENQKLNENVDDVSQQHTEEGPVETANQEAEI